MPSPVTFDLTQFFEPSTESVQYISEHSIETAYNINAECCLPESAPSAPEIDHCVGAVRIEDRPTTAQPGAAHHLRNKAEFARYPRCASQNSVAIIKDCRQKGNWRLKKGERVFSERLPPGNTLVPTSDSAAIRRYCVSRR